VIPRFSFRRASPRRTRRAAALAAVLVSGALALSGCTQIVDAFNNLQNETSGAGTVATPSASPSASMAFNSQFTYDGSVTLSSDIGDELELRLDVWAVDPKRTAEWTPDSEKVFGYAVNVYDGRTDEKAVLTEKRRVYMSSIQITSQTAQSTGQVQSPFQFSADPRTMVPTDTQRSDKGLLLNSYQGGFYVPQQTIHQLPSDTYGLTLEFAMTVWVEDSSNSGGFQQQVVYEYLPVAIYPS
jgi:hypothetical protein